VTLPLHRYNLLAIERLAQDVGACQSFASRCHLHIPAALPAAGGPALSEGGLPLAEQQEAAAAAAAAQGASFAQEFAEAAQLCRLLMSETVGTATCLHYTADCVSLSFWRATQ
jgi:hypothetical protein